jgi:hypothetical protein
MKRIRIRDTNSHDPSLESLTSISLKGVKLDGRTIFNGLQGHWELQRRLGEYGTMWGDVVFIKVDDYSFRYHESGYVYLEHTNKRYKAFKSQLYTYDQEKLLIHNCDPHSYKKKGLLHTLDLSTCKTPQPVCLQSEYVCKEDIYQLDWVLMNPHQLQFNYVVKGPAKSYTIQTKLLKRHKHRK